MNSTYYITIIIGRQIFQDELILTQKCFLRCHYPTISSFGPILPRQSRSFSVTKRCTALQ